MSTYWLRRGTVYLLVILAIAVVFYSAFKRDKGYEEWSLNAVAEAAKEGQVRHIFEANARQLFVTLENDTVVTVYKDANSTAQQQLSALGVTPNELAAIEWDTDATPIALKTFNRVAPAVLLFLFAVLFLYVVIRREIASWKKVRKGGS